MPGASVKVVALAAVCAIVPALSSPLLSRAAAKRMRAAPAPPVLRIAPVGEPGIRLTVRGTLVDRSGKPIGGAELHAYQTDARGRYTFAKPMDEPHARLSGRLRSGSDGRFELRTIRPGGYPKSIMLEGVHRRIPAHIHLDVRVAGRPERRFQLVFADDPLLLDPYWKDWVAKQGQPVLNARDDHGGLAGAVLLTID
jgi:protocatechuate 3,4-dioxygenase beta subunit